MKAYVLHEQAECRLEQVDNPQPEQGEVLVKVKAAGICGSDLPRIYGKGAHTYPLIPGHEFAGVVTGLGVETGKSWMGKRVGIFPLIPCYACIPCKNRKYEICRNYSYLGSRRDGGFAEYAAVPQQNLIELPEQVTFEEAAMLEPMAVAVHAMRRASPQATDTIVVCGLGTIGLLLVMFLKEAGIGRVLTIGNKSFQKTCVCRIGIEESEYCDSRTQNVGEWLTKQTVGYGADIFFECVGKNETLVQAVGYTGAEGKVITVGNPVSDMFLEQSVYWKILRNQITLIGTWNSQFTRQSDDDWHYVLERLQERKVNPSSLITHRLTLEDLNRGLAIMRNKEEDYVKVMTLIP